MLRASKASCFVDSIELAFGFDATELAVAYCDLLPDSNPDADGFHPTPVNLILLERFGRGLTELDAMPADEEGRPLPDCLAIGGTLVNWFARPGFACVVQGLDAVNSEHAIAYKNGKWYDPRIGNTALENPTIRIRSFWILDLAKDEANLDQA